MSPNLSPAVIEAYEARLIIEDVLEALDEVQAVPVGDYRVSPYAQGQLDMASRIRSLIEDGEDK